MTNSFLSHFDNENKILSNRYDSIRPVVEAVTAEFSNQGHSGSSARWVINALRSAFNDSTTISNIEVDKLYTLLKDQTKEVQDIILYSLQFKPISPLLGEEQEWMEVTNNVYQNKRLGSVFKNNGVVTWLDGSAAIEILEDGTDWGAYSTSDVPEYEVQFPFDVEEHRTIYYVRKPGTREILFKGEYDSIKESLSKLLIEVREKYLLGLKFDGTVDSILLEPLDTDMVDEITTYFSTTIKPLLDSKLLDIFKPDSGLEPILTGTMRNKLSLTAQRHVLRLAYQYHMGIKELSIMDMVQTEYLIRPVLDPFSNSQFFTWTNAYPYSISNPVDIQYSKSSTQYEIGEPYFRLGSRITDSEKEARTYLYNLAKKADYVFVPGKLGPITKKYEFSIKERRSPLLVDLKIVKS